MPGTKVLYRGFIEHSAPVPVLRMQEFAQQIPRLGIIHKMHQPSGLSIGLLQERPILAHIGNAIEPFVQRHNISMQYGVQRGLIVIRRMIFGNILNRFF